MKIKAFILCVVAVMLSLAAPAETVTFVADGDKLVLSETGNVRLYGIDAPERNQHGDLEALIKRGEIER